jgi:cysteine desulfurase
LDKEAIRLKKLRDKLEISLLELEETHLNGSIKQRLPHVTNIAFKYVESDALMMTLNKEIAISSGSACTSASLEPSYVLKALGWDDDLAHGSLRFSLGRFTTEEEIDFTIEKVKSSVKTMREMSPLWDMYKKEMI